MELKKLIGRMLESRGLSRAGLAYALGYKSATSVARVIEGSCGRESTGEFLQRMLSCAPLALTAEERMLLIACLDSRDLGEENEGMYRAFGRLIENTRSACGNPALKEIILRHARHSCGNCEGIRITLFNCADEGSMWELYTVIEEAACPVKLDHYISVPRTMTETVNVVKAVLPLLHRDYYRCMLVDFKDAAPLKGLFGADGALITCRYRGGVEKQWLIFLYGRDGESLIPLETHTEPEELLGKLGTIRPINGTALPRPNESQLTHLELLTDLERGHAVYQIRPCFGVEQVPAELVIRIGLDGREADGTETQKKLISLERRREANLNGNKRPQYHIYREADLARFAATGLMSSHPSTVRPFTCSERVQILERLEERLTRNPYFHLFFLREDDPWVDDEVTLYEKKGLFMVKPGGDSGGVWGGRSGTLLVGPEELLAAYKSFYLDRLVRTRCRSAAESAKILRRLISKANKHADA